MPPEFIRQIAEKLKAIWETADAVARTKAVDRIEDELEELEYIFAVLTQGAFIGMPAPPVQISMDLLPEMERELVLLMDRVETANEPLSRLFSVFDIS